MLQKKGEKQTTKREKKVRKPWEKPKGCASIKRNELVESSLDKVKFSFWRHKPQ